MTSRLSLIAAGLFLFFYSSWVYVNFTQPLFAYANFSYNAGTATSFFLLVAIASIALLLALVDRHLKPAHLFLFVVFVFVLNGILVTGIHFITIEQASSAVALVLLGSAIMVPLSNLTLAARIRGSTRFELRGFRAVRRGLGDHRRGSDAAWPATGVVLADLRIEERGGPFRARPLRTFPLRVRDRSGRSGDRALAAKLPVRGSGDRDCSWSFTC